MKLFKNNTNLKIKADTCCVCYEFTLTKTPCKHYLCYMCWDKIDNDLINNKCPLCRHFLDSDENSEYMYSNEYSDDESNYYNEM